MVERNFIFMYLIIRLLLFLANGDEKLFRMQ